jgi:hypothetical protein
MYSLRNERERLLLDVAPIVPMLYTGARCSEFIYKKISDPRIWRKTCASES